MKLFMSWHFWIFSIFIQQTYFFLTLNNLYKTAFLHHYGLHMFAIYCKGNKMPVFYNLKYLTVAHAENYILRN